MDLAFLSFILITLSFFSAVNAEETIVKSIYTTPIDEITETKLTDLSFKFSKSDENIHLACLETDAVKNYIGLWHGFTINAPLKIVATILDDFNNYPIYFEGIVSAKIIQKNPKDILVQFENKSPVFFVPNIVYQMNYSIESLKQKKIYRYHLSSMYKQSNIHFSDGLIYLGEDNGKTKFYELDFFNANLGIAEKFASSRIWPDSIKELMLSDFELKVNAENLNITKEDKGEKLKLLMNDRLLEKCLKNKIPALDFFKKIN